MSFFKPVILKVTSLISLLSITSISYAISVGNMKYLIPQNHPTSVPTLSGVMILLLSLLLFVVAFRVAKQKKKETTKLFISLIGIAALLSGVGGVKIVSDVRAGASTVPMDIAAGTTRGEVILQSGDNYFDNPNTVPATIVSINVTNESYSCREAAFKPINPAAPYCVVGNTVLPGEQCKISCLRFLSLIE